MATLIPVILAGGTGSRLWPLSRALFPKQFHTIFGERSLLQNTLTRAARITGEAPIIVCNHEHRFLVAEQCRAIGIDWRSIILEPEGRNTAPAIALAALACATTPDAQLLVLPSDHLIEDDTAFGTAVTLAQAAAGEGALVTFGIQPSHPETGYGYICAPGAIVGDAATAVSSFVEKPDAATAENYVDSGDYFWNSGMFVLGAGEYLEELQTLSPDMASTVRLAHESGSVDLDFFRPGDAFLQCPADSIDYAVDRKSVV